MKLPKSEVWINPDHLVAVRPGGLTLGGGGRPTLVFLTNMPDPISLELPISEFIKFMGADDDSGENSPTP